MRMNTKFRDLAVCCTVVGCVLLAALAGAQAPRGAAGPSKAQLVEPFGRLPLSFEPNQGQTSPEVKFLARGSGYGLFLTPTEMVLALTQPPAASSPKGPSGKESVLRMKLVGANPKPDMVGERELPGRSNYFSGKDPARWRRNVPQFAGVRYRGVYPGVDVVYYGNQRQLEYDFVVAPGADPRAIRLRFSGASSVKLNPAGDVVLGAAAGDVTVRAPVIYQEVDGSRQPVTGRFVRRGAREVGFEIGRYDASRTLTIDPTLVYSTYLGGASNERAWGAVDTAGNVFLVGLTWSANFPWTDRLNEIHSGSYSQTFIAKLNADGRSLAYSTFIDTGMSQLSFVAVDRLGQAYVAGDVYLRDAPVLNAVQPTCQAVGGYLNWCQSLYVLKLSAAGDSLVYATYLGGTEPSPENVEPRTSLRSIATDLGENTYLVGSTGSPTFPTVNALQGSLKGERDAFVVKLDPQGGWVYSTYLGGSARDGAASVATDARGNAYVVGATDSQDFPVLNAVQIGHSGADPTRDGFITALNPGGSALVYSTYFGGTQDDWFESVAATGGGTAYVLGGTWSGDFPITPGRLQPGPCGSIRPYCPNPRVLVKFLADGQVDYSTAMRPGGGILGDGRSLALDSSENIYLGGSNGGDYLTRGPLVDPLMTPAIGRGTNVILEKLDPSATTVLFSTFWGGSTSPNALDPCTWVPGWDLLTSIAVDGAGNIYLIGWTTNAYFPTLNAMQPGPGGVNPCEGSVNDDGFIVKIAQRDNTPAGSQVAVVPADGASITFADVSSPGTTSFASEPDAQWYPPPPDGFRLGEPPAFYEISTTASFTGGVTVCVDYSKVAFSVEWGLGLYHYENGTWTNITTSVDTTNNRICGVATSLSPFAIFGAPLPPVSVVGFAPPLAPLAAVGSPVSWPDKAFKFGRTLPLKLQLLVNGTPLTDQEVNGPKIVEISRQGDSVLNLATLDLNTGVANDNGLVFRFSEGSWIYNLNTQALSTGRYVITIGLWDGRRFQGGFELKR
jgi:hypothetical protein